MGAVGVTEPEAVSLVSVGINVRRGHDGALPSVLPAAGCSEGHVVEQRNQAYCLSTWMGLLRLLVALGGRGSLEYRINRGLPRSSGSMSWVSHQVGSCWEMAQRW